MITYLAFDKNIQQWNLVRSYEVPTSLEGVSPGDSKSDLVFRKGAPLGKDICHFCDEDFAMWDHPFIAVTFENNRVETINGLAHRIFDSLPLQTTEGLIEMFGEPDILAISADHLERRYTYLDGGITYKCNQNELVGVMIGKVEWRSGVAGAAYFVDGKQFCPVADCPFDAEGESKPEYKGKSYKDLPLD